MNQVPVQSNKSYTFQYTTPLPSTRYLLNLAKRVMRRNSGPHWTEELRAFYESIEKDEADKERYRKLFGEKNG